MTADEFRREARNIGLAEHVIDCEIRLHEKFLREGLTPISYEMALAAKKKRASCLDAFDMALTANT